MSVPAQELVCEICGRDYPVWSADNDLWNAVMRLPDGSDQHAFVCPTCFVVRAAFAGVETSFCVVGTGYGRAIRKDALTPRLTACVKAYGPSSMVYWWAHKDGVYVSGSVRGFPGSEHSLGRWVRAKAQSVGVDDWAWHTNPDAVPAWFVDADPGSPEAP